MPLSETMKTLVVVIAVLALCASTGCGDDSFLFGAGGVGGSGQGGEGATTTGGAGGTTGTGGGITTGGAGGTGGGTTTGGAGGTPPCRGLLFDGTSDLVRVPDHAQLDGLAQLTVEAWVYVSSTARATILSHHQDGQTKSGFMLEHMNNKALAFRMFSGNISYADGGSVLTQIQQATWTHVAAVFDGSAIRLYLNGVLEDGSSATLSQGVIGDYAGHLHIGANAAAPEGFFNGMMDEVRISSVPRYVGPTFTPPTAPFVSDPQTIALWHFDESAGQQVLDATGLHDGTLGTTGGPEPSDPARMDVPCIVDMLP